MFTALFALVQILIGFVPFIATGLAITACVWVATKLSPAFRENVESLFDGLFGVDETYDETYDTGYQTTRRY